MQKIVDFEITDEQKEYLIGNADRILSGSTLEAMIEYKRIFNREPSCSDLGTFGELLRHLSNRHGGRSI